MQVPNDVPGMLPQFQRVMREMKEAQTPGNKKKCKVDEDNFVVDITDEAMIQKICNTHGFPIVMHVCTYSFRHDSYESIHE